MQAQPFLKALNTTDKNKHCAHTIPGSSLIRKCWEMKLAAILSGELSSENTAGVCKHTTQQLCSSAQGVLFRLFKHTDTVHRFQTKQTCHFHTSETSTAL